MKNTWLIIILISIALLSSSCSQKMPLPNSDDTGLLVVPVTSRNLTSYQYGYYYIFIYSPETEVQLKIVPRGGRNFVMINNLPPDRYEISGIRAISAANTGRGRPHVSAETTEFDRPIPFEIHANEVTLLNYQLYIEQKFLSPSVINRYSQGHSLRPLDEIQQKQIIGELQSLENTDLWNMSQLSATKLPSPEDGIISTNELQLSSSDGWGRR